MKRAGIAAIVAVLLTLAAGVLSSCSKPKPAQPELGPRIIPNVARAPEQPKPATEATEPSETAESEKAEGQHEEAAETHEEQGEQAEEQSNLPEETLKGEEVTLTDDNFDDIIGKQGVVALVDFWAEWCGPCLQQAPIVEEIAKEYKGKVVVGKVNVDQAGKLADRFKINAIPTLIVFKDGEEVERAIGLHDKSALEAMIDRALGE